MTVPLRHKPKTRLFVALIVALLIIGAGYAIYRHAHPVYDEDYYMSKYPRAEDGAKCVEEFMRRNPQLFSENNIVGAVVPCRGTVQ